MVAIPDRIYMSPEEFLEWEEQQDIKHEYINGEVFAMTGGTIPHTTIALNLAAGLKNHLRGGKCRPFMADAKVGISGNGPFHYPDVMVSCDQRDKQAIKFIQFPCLIVEVLSPSTEAYDRGGKFQQYRRIETLQEYVLISADKIGLDCFRLNEKGLWELHPFVEGDEVHLVSVDFTFPLSLVYEDVF
ncbi:Uma2 family endonuclease [Dolichospermum sp. ST_con]|nr:Uma2 family endonuclease [Dolichospermum sp. ST_con]MDD1420323.1 Uma2 family endonuclease [Dolichospermum sp. ST_sed1]MDD1425385.1 Uma2 family endonuclease [Dolichospermum sp. ST_sed9]MDD1430849.1 Uma2 family endonuclease [Dolichospermum sp. ST_sed6]MDD1436983.1 Uma2 family endonuclease [Dolichospermum sp. ST_sed10]MDD1441805.1 Uma2 family endonuclease [Dolichospermum sp. ST_sed3]MDD1446083.1 Uma2 family endonuclease [Dolichospermum sp. ST_sed8]MDD1454264.1 Uma2 family endonuclease [Dolic